MGFGTRLDVSGVRLEDIIPVKEDDFRKLQINGNPSEKCLGDQSCGKYADCGMSAITGCGYLPVLINIACKWTLTTHEQAARGL